jgi:hypothetical protein
VEHSDLYNMGRVRHVYKAITNIFNHSFENRRSVYVSSTLRVDSILKVKAKLLMSL